VQIKVVAWNMHQRSPGGNWAELREDPELANADVFSAKPRTRLCVDQVDEEVVDGDPRLVGVRDQLLRRLGTAEREREQAREEERRPAVDSATTRKLSVRTGSPILSPARCAVGRVEVPGALRSRH
jgi:hypothetical protein